jgi:hypothetical protein
MKKRGGLLKVYVLTAMVSAVLIPAENAVGGPDIHRIDLIDSKLWLDGMLEPKPYGIFAAVMGSSDITSVTMTPPGKSPIDLDCWKCGPGWCMWEFEAEDYATLAALRANFDVGDYIFTFNGGADSVTLSHNPVKPTGFANITYPSHGATDVPLNLTTTWDSCVGYGDGLGFSLWDETVYKMVEVTYPHVDIAQTSWISGPLEPGHLYELEVSVFNGTAPQPYDRTTDLGDNFIYYDLFEYTNAVYFNTIPAPGAFVLAVIGASVVGWLRRRRKL